ncbi:GntR family transcriptional regulator [Clostridium psychrophilum]|uniref:GntR family transcriptional regulator n=1 Tax=Clostridium psychrophilum TaxID=132926 RepID=UPI001C0E4C33|nr:GntR family transcriptional regulator [Clostridium psychrophilum]MBU3183142.1 GntR family transcriptional regulator [Clostridium psychrophilum]
MNNEALYIQLMNNIKKKITDGEYQVGDKIMSERTMSKTYGINRLTVRNAIKNLQIEGYLNAIQGKGTFVNKIPVVQGKVELGSGDVSLSMSIRKGGMSHSRIVLSLKKIYAIGNLKNYFPDSPQVYELIRLSFINGIPYAIQECYFPCSYFKEAERYNFVEDALYDYMDTQGHHPQKLDYSLKIKDVPQKYTKLLEIQAGKKIFFFNYFAYDKDKKIVEYTLSYNKPEYTSFHFSTKKGLLHI